MKRSPLLFATVAAALLLGACGSDSTTGSSSGSSTSVPAPVEQALDDLTIEYGCGYGFYLSNPDQTVGLFISTNHPDVPEVSDLVTDDIWSTELQIGEDLFANWCDDIIEVGEPEPRVTDRWSLSAGSISIDLRPTECGGESAIATLSDVVVLTSNGTQIELDDIDITNNAWGCFAG